MSFIQDLKHQLRKLNTLTTLICMNVCVFVVINVALNIFNFSFLEYLALPVNFSMFLTRFWTLLTYMFSHESLGHLFYNMLLLYFTGRMFCNLLTEKRFLFVYLLSGISGAFLLLLFSLVLPVAVHPSLIIGASAAILGVISALAMYTPNLPVNIWGLIEIRYKYLALIIFVLLTIFDFAINTGGKITHFGGAFFGLLYGYLLKNGRDLSSVSFYKRKRKSKLQVIQTNPSYTPHSNSASQKTIDVLLDKISKSGYDSLSKAEKELLFKLSQRK